MAKTTTAKKTGLKEKLLVDYEVFENNLKEEEKSPVHDIRRAALEKFNENGFPSTKVEDWKYTNVRWISKGDFEQVSPDDVPDLDQQTIEDYQIPGLKTNTLVIVNGCYVDELSQIHEDKEDLFIGSFSRALQEKPDRVKKYFAQYAGYENKEDSFTALNTAFARDGVFIDIPKGYTFEHPVMILHIADTTEGTYIHQPRHLAIAGPSSNVTIIEKYHTIGEDRPALTNSVTELHIDANASMQYYKIQNDNYNAYHVGRTELRQERDSNFTSYTISWGGGLVRNDLNNIHLDENCTTKYYGAYVSQGKQHIDNHTLMDHDVPNCYSDELYKGILDDKSTCVFNGKVLVREGSVQTQAYQENKNILLTDDAKINTKPQLEIFNDDVVASHGATSGQLNDRELFYLRSRGIDKDRAKALLLFAFVGDVFSKIKSDEINHYLKNELSLRLLDEPLEE